MRYTLNSRHQGAQRHAATLAGRKGMHRRLSPIQTHCYLCGCLLADGRPTSRDHIFPRQLMTRKNPRERGFDYGGVIETHAECNNRFSPERMTPKALALISALNDPHKMQIVGRRGDELLLNNDCLSDFSQRDIDFFGLEHGLPATASDLLDSLGRATKVAASALTKSAAALIVDRYLPGVPNAWRVLAAPKNSAEPIVCLRSIFGDQRPFEVATDIYAKLLGDRREDFVVAYVVRQFVLLLYFGFSADTSFARQVGGAMTEDGGSLLKWEGECLMELCASPSPWTEVSA
jgi:hypothetical protein